MSTFTSILVSPVAKPKPKSGPYAGRGLILIVARNNKALTQSAVKSALGQEHPCDVWVIDNASSDDTLQWLRAKAASLDALHWWTHPVQKSLAACWNEGLVRGFKLHTRILVINNDVELRPDTFHLLAEWGGDFTTGVSVNSKLELRTSESPISQSAHPDFSCFMINRHCFTSVGGFDETFFPAYFEDNDYHVRMHRAGIDAISIDLPFFHYAAGTLKNAVPAEAANIRVGATINADRFFDKYGCYPADTEAYNELFTPIKRKS